ncbi:MAG: prolipoprotein diacylglyceryl transferase [Planctomycetota bacterium]|jgi:phosphatidylglycerol:prolipoprotein diacylglycerol transferase
MRRILFYIPLEYLDLPNIPVFSYGFMMMLGFLSAIMLAKRQAKKDGIEKDRIYDVSLIAIISGIIGSRLLWLLLFAPEGTWKSIREIVAVWNGGLVYYGGLILALVCCGIYIKRKKMPLGLTVDCFAPGLAVGIFFGRIGCFLNGCCYGAVCDLSWHSIKFPAGSPAIYHHFGMDAIHQTESLPVYPSQLISSLSGLLCMIILLILFKYRKFPGQMTFYFLQIYAVFRFLIEYLRDDTEPYFVVSGFSGLKAGQIVAVITFIFATAMMIYLKRKHSLKEPAKTDA